MNRFTWLLLASLLMLGAGMYAETLGGWGVAAVVLVTLFCMMQSADAHYELKQAERRADDLRDMKRQHREEVIKDAEDTLKRANDFIERETGIPPKPKGHPDEHAWPNEPWRAEAMAASMTSAAMWSAAISAQVEHMRAMESLAATEREIERMEERQREVREMQRAAKHATSIEVFARWVEDPQHLPPPERTP